MSDLTHLFTIGQPVRCRLDEKFLKERGIKMSNSNRITRESMDSIIEEIMGVSDCDWLSEDSKPREIERILVDAGIVEVIEAPVEGSGKSAD